jgi:hypothetical protein
MYYSHARARHRNILSTYYNQNNGMINIIIEHISSSLLGENKPRMHYIRNIATSRAVERLSVL